MMKKLLLALGVVVLAVAGSIVAWRLADDEPQRKGVLTLATTVPQLTVATGPSMTSPNGDYRIVVADSGITLAGPNGSVKIDSAGVLVKSSSNSVSVSPTTVDIAASGSASVRGTLVRIGCSSGGQPVLRGNSPIAVQGQVSVGPDGGTFPIQANALPQGSATVLAC
jgi:hypothetical protein